MLCIILSNLNIYAEIRISESKRYQLHGSVRDVSIFKFDDIKVVTPLDVDTNKQLLNAWDIYYEYQRLPKALKDNISEVCLLDYPYYYEEPPIRIIATHNGDLKRISIYQNGEIIRIQTVKEELKKVFVHEAAHGLDSIINASSSLEWKTAIDNDYLERKRLYIDPFNRSLSEDFAESVSKYLNNDYFKIDFPNRYKYIENILN